jgi:hypothetical protein
LRVPINHFEGNYVCDAATLDAVARRRSDRRALRAKPNGSLDDIAGICNEGRNVVGLMPHPERASDTVLGSADGVVLLESLLAAARARRFERVRIRRFRTRARATWARRRPFAAPTAHFSASFPSGDHRYVLDMGCGPGYTTTLLLEAFPHSFVTGIDASAAMVDEARARVAGAQLRGGRRHRADRAARACCVRAAVARPSPGSTAVRSRTGPRRFGPGGLVVCEEPVRYRSANACFVRYEAARHGRRCRARRHVVGERRAR